MFVWIAREQWLGLVREVRVALAVGHLEEVMTQLGALVATFEADDHGSAVMLDPR